MKKEDTDRIKKAVELAIDKEARRMTEERSGLDGFESVDLSGFDQPEVMRRKLEEAILATKEARGQVREYYEMVVRNIETARKAIEQAEEWKKNCEDHKRTLDSLQIENREKDCEIEGYRQEVEKLKAQVVILQRSILSYEQEQFLATRDARVRIAGDGRIFLEWLDEDFSNGRMRVINTHYHMTLADAVREAMEQDKQN